MRMSSSICYIFPICSDKISPGPSFARMDENRRGMQLSVQRTYDNPLEDAREMKLRLDGELSIERARSGFSRESSLTGSTTPNPSKSSDFVGRFPSFSEDVAGSELSTAWPSPNPFLMDADDYMSEYPPSTIPDLVETLSSLSPSELSIAIRGLVSLHPNLRSVIQSSLE